MDAQIGGLSRLILRAFKIIFPRVLLRYPAPKYYRTGSRAHYKDDDERALQPLGNFLPHRFFATR
jgi:hypothetical protein